MAIIYSYPTGTVQATDMVIGSDPTIVGNPTKNFRIGDISTFVKNDILGYNVYTSLVTQAGVIAPTEVLLKNNTGATMTWNYNGPGAYSITSSLPIFLQPKTMACIMGQEQDSHFVTWQWFNTSTIEVYVYDSTGNPADGSLLNLSFEIRIYS